MTDLKEAVGSKIDVSLWMVDGEEFKYVKGEAYVRSRTSLSSPWEIWPITSNNKTAAKRKVFELIK